MSRPLSQYTALPQEIKEDMIRSRFCVGLIGLPVLAIFLDERTDSGVILALR